MRPAQSLVCKDVEVLPSLLRWSGGKLLVNPDQIIYEGFEPEAILICAVITVVDGGVTFGGQNICIAQHLVADNFLPVVEVSVMILDKSDRIERRESG